MPKEYSYDAFFSYSAEDKAKVHALAERLRDDGLKIWLDDWIIKPGDSIPLAIEDGLQNSRTLLVCMSNSYFESSWTGLERHTILFRDPANERTSFVPILLEECDLPSTIAQFAHIDWRESEEGEYKRLRSSCTRIAGPPEPSSKSDDVAGEADTTVAPVVTFRGHEKWVEVVAIDPSGKRVLSGSGDNTIKIWDLEQGNLIATLNGHSGAVRGIAISTDGTTAVLAASDKTLKIWDLKDQRLLTTLECDENTLEGPQKHVWSVAISPDGKKLVSGSGDPHRQDLGS